MHLQVWLRWALKGLLGHAATAVRVRPLGSWFVNQSEKRRRPNARAFLMRLCIVLGQELVESRTDDRCRDKLEESC